MKNIVYKTKRNSLILFSALALGGLYSCKDTFLDVPPEGQGVSENFFVTQEQALQGANAMYGNLREWNVIAFAHLALTTITSDDAEKGSVPGDAGFLDLYDNFDFSATEGTLNGYWSGQYQGINLANQVLEKVPPITMDENLKSRLLAEARFIRAYHFFNLVRAFGGVPLVSKLPVSPEELNPARASREEAYAFIEDDLTKAAQVLPASYPATEVGRATKGAALSLLAKVSLYQRKWAEVVALTDQVAALGYTLTPDYNQIFRIAGENNSESIFEIQSQTLAGNCGAANSQWAEVQGVREQFGWGFSIPTADLENAFEPGDKRKDATILFRGEVTPEGDKIHDNAPNPRYNQKAYVPSTVTQDCGYGRDQNVRIIRYADVLLMQAEAANELGQTEKALAALNQVRRRAGLAGATFTSQEDLRTRIWHERRVELALENGDRFFDLVRQGQAPAVFQKLGKHYQAGRNEVFPIPQTQIDLSTGRLTQNPNY